MANLFSKIMVRYGDYLIISNGQIFSLKRNHFLSDRGYQDSYIEVGLIIGGMHEQWRIHALMAHVFYGPRSEGMQVRHLNGDKRDNRLSNLVYGTPLENTMDKYRHGTMLYGEDSPGAKLTNAQVIDIKERLLNGEDYRVIAATTIVHPITIFAIKIGRTWKKIGKPVRIFTEKKLTPEKRVLIIKHIKSGIRIQEVADSFGINVSTVSRLFRMTTGQSIREYRKDR